MSVEALAAADRNVMSSIEGGKMSIKTVSMIKSSKRMIEIYVWIFLGFLFSGRLWLLIITKGYFSPEYLPELYFDILLGIVAVLFPILFHLIFGALPFETLQRKIKQQSMSNIYVEKLNIGESYKDVSPSLEAGIEKTIKKDKEKFEVEPEELLNILALESHNLSKKIYNRSGVYLLIGVLIAFVGLIFFYTQTIELREIKEISNLVMLILPRFGILFFIEFIAFFFLKQYQSSMDEFRYYEEVKRCREDNLALVKLASRDWKDIDFLQLISMCNYSKKAGVISKDETTEILESKKLQKDEYEILLKLAELIKPLKVNGSSKT
jgi:hypothetical protein